MNHYKRNKNVIIHLIITVRNIKNVKQKPKKTQHKYVSVHTYDSNDTITIFNKCLYFLELLAIDHERKEGPLLCKGVPNFCTKSNH